MLKLWRVESTSFDLSVLFIDFDKEKEAREKERKKEKEWKIRRKYTALFICSQLFAFLLGSLSGKRSDVRDQL